MIPIKLSEPEEQKHKRPELLTLLCVLTFIGSGLAAFSNLSISLAYSDIDEIIASSGFDIPGIDEALSAGRSFFVFSSILYFLSLIGAVNMWKLKKSDSIFIASHR